jgi:hypothetical protein
VSEDVRIVVDALAGTGPALVQKEQAALRQPRQVRVRDQLGADGIAELRRDFEAGVTREALAAQYGISLSSVKRLLRWQTPGA